MIFHYTEGSDYDNLTPNIINDNPSGKIENKATNCGKKT